MRDVNSQGGPVLYQVFSERMLGRLVVLGQLAQPSLYKSYCCLQKSVI